MTTPPGTLPRRDACKSLAGATVAACLPAGHLTAQKKGFRLRYIVASCMYGKAELDNIVPEVPKTKAEHLDVWPARHGNQREQVEAMGHERFVAMLRGHAVKLGILTRYDLGPYRLRRELQVARKLGASLVVCGSQGPKNLSGTELKTAVRAFAEKMKPHIAVAEELGVTIGIENHGGALINTPDSQLWFAESARSKHIGIALAPYHLPQDQKRIARLVAELGPRLVHFYAWQHGKGCFKKLPKDEELLQLPGRGPLDFTPILASLKKNEYQGWTEVFMHPVPRGIPILEPISRVTAEINRSREYLEDRLRKL